MNKLKIAKALNAFICFALTVLLMFEVYLFWRMYAPYTIVSFFVSLVIHGGMGVVVYLCINHLLDRILK